MLKFIFLETYLFCFFFFSFRFSKNTSPLLLRKLLSVKVSMKLLKSFTHRGSFNQHA